MTDARKWKKLTRYPNTQISEKGKYLTVFVHIFACKHYLSTIKGVSMPLNLLWSSISIIKGNA